LKELQTAGSHEGAIQRTHVTIGRAIAIAGAIVFTGFSVLMLSGFNPTIYFGLFTGLALLMGLFCSLTLLPSLFRLFRYPQIKT
jgi:predicted RND superfamily exporter protein